MFVVFFRFVMLLQVFIVFLVLIILLQNVFCVVNVHHVVIGVHYIVGVHNFCWFFQILPLLFIVLLLVLLCCFPPFYGWYYRNTALSYKLKFHRRWKVVGCLQIPTKPFRFYVSCFFHQICVIFLFFLVLKIMCWFYVWICLYKNSLQIEDIAGKRKILHNVFCDKWILFHIL